MIKKLEWTEFNLGKRWYANTPFGSYYVRPDEFGEYIVTCPDKSVIIKSSSDPEILKQEAQIDFEGRIRRCFEDEEKTPSRFLETVAKVIHKKLGTPTQPLGADYGATLVLNRMNRIQLFELIGEALEGRDG